VIAAAPSCRRLASADRLRAIRVGALAIAAALAAGLLATSLALSGHTASIIGLVAILLPLAAWRTPYLSIAMLVLAATTVEQARYIPLWADIGTDEILYFTSLNDSVGLGGVLISPLELTTAVILLVWLLKATADRSLRLPRSHLAIGLAVFFVIILLAATRGLAAGADLRTVLRELRPWVYLVVIFLLASQLITRRAFLKALLWAFTIGVAFKGLQGTYRYLLVVLAGTVNPRPEFILGHEDAVFFSVYILLTAALWMFGERTRLRRFATALLPAVVLANLANNRRTAWLIVAAGVLALLVIAWIRLPQRRLLIRNLALVLTAGGLLYFPLFWESGALWAEPARAVRSAFAPDERDRLSNLYRNYENANLMSNIRRSTPLGQGFGVPIDYSTFPGHDVADQGDRTLRFTPHDGILYVWMVTGIPGALAFWFVLGAAMIAACRLARSPDRQLALFGTFAVCAVLAYVIEGYYDFGLSWYRVAVLMGCVLGALDAAQHLGQTALAARLAPRAA
jgi:hypothetical protein